MPYPPGGTADIIARLFFAAVSSRLGQPFVVENCSGATGTIGAAAAVQAAPDGYTLLHDATGLSVTPALFDRLPYDPVRDLVPVFRTATVPQLVLVNPSSPAKDVPGLVALAKVTRGGLDAGSDGNGSMQHLVLERFARAAGVTLNHVAYRGGAPAVNDLIAGQIQLYFGNVNVSAPFVRSRSRPRPEDMTLADGGSEHPEAIQLRFINPWNGRSGWSGPYLTGHRA